MSDHPDRHDRDAAARDRLRRRAAFLRELAEARALRRRVAPRRNRQLRIRAALRRQTLRPDQPPPRYDH